MRGFQIGAFLKYYSAASTIYDIHSPYLFSLVDRLFDNKMYYAFGEIEPYRDRYKRNSTRINLVDHGAGNKNGSFRTISQIVRQASSTETKCRYLFNLVRYFQPECLLEIGTNLGIASSYLSYAASKGFVHTVEGDSNLVEQAEELFLHLGLQNITVYHLRFKDFFSKHSNLIDCIDFAYVDGNHTYEATLEMTNVIMDNQQKNKVVIVDDIYWSKEMNNAWEQLKTNYSDCLILELMQIGIIIRDAACPIANVIQLIPLKYKPWRIGLTAGKH